MTLPAVNGKILIINVCFDLNILIILKELNKMSLN